MNNREKLLENYVRLSGISFHNNVAFAHSKYQVNWKKTALTMWLGHIVSKKTEFYVLSFEREGITFMQYDNLKFLEGVYFFDYRFVTDFKVKKKGAESEMRFMYQGEEVVLMLQRYALDSPWIKEYMQYLEENHFFYE